MQELRGDGSRVEIGTDQKARAGRRREGNGYGEFRVVAPADAGVSLGPREIKHELAIGVRFDEGRRGGGESGCVRQGDICRVPARAGTDTVRVLERGEEFMTQERVAVAPERVPLPWIELVDAVVDLGSWRRLRQECFSTSRDSR